MQKDKTKAAFVISIKSIIINIFLFFIKFVCGLLINSSSLISDGIHSLSDILTTLAVMTGVKFSNNPPDENHPYGHEKIESVVAFILGFVLLLVGINIGFNGIKTLIVPTVQVEKNKPLLILGLLTALTSIIFKEWSYQFTIKFAKKSNSKAMEADAWHHRSDALSSISSLLGVVGIFIGLQIIDSIACVIISLFIIKAAFDIELDAFKNLVDHACPDNIILEVESLVTSQKNITSLDILKTRMFGCMIYIDIEITVDGSISLFSAHAIAEKVHDSVENNINNVKHCMVHVNPAGLAAHHHI